MNKQSHHILFTLLLLLFVIPSGLYGQAVTSGKVNYPAQAGRKSTGYPDLDRFYYRIERSTYQASRERQAYLMRTVPLDHYIKEFVERGFDVLSDTVSLMEFYVFGTKPLDELFDAAKRYKSERLQLYAEFLEAYYISDSTTTYDLKMALHEKIIRKAQKAGEEHLEAFVLYNMWYSSFFSQRYSQCFKYAKRMADLLDNIKDYPNCAESYAWIGISYFTYGDYDRALEYFNKSLSYREPLVFPRAWARIWNYQATYHHMNGNLDSAMYYHRAILLSEQLDFYTAHHCIAIGNMGHILKEKNRADEAIAYLTAAYDNMPEKDPSFSSGLQISIAECYMQKGDFTTAARHIEKSKVGLDTLPDFDRQKRLKNIYSVQNRYYTQLGETENAVAYLDSALISAAEYERLTGQHYILLGEQELQEAEAQLARERIRQQRMFIFIVLAVLCVLSVAFILIVRLYNRRNAAYRKLALKAQEWALGVRSPKKPVHDKTSIPDSEHGCRTKAEEPTEEDMHIMAILGKEMTQRYAYREMGLTAEVLAERLGIHRNALSRAINRTTGGNFNNYINGYRIKEAVRIISETDRRQLYIEEVYERVGFGNRNSFYRVFKKFTGLTPAEFQKSKDGTICHIDF